MLKVAADIRTSYPSGIFRYGSGVLGRLAENMARAGVELAVLYGPNLKAAQVETLAGLVAAHGARLVRVPDAVGFGRDSAWLREWLVRQDVDLYYSFNYLVDALCPVPYVFTIYDLIRLKHPRFSYTDAAFRQKFGPSEFEAIRSALKRFEEYVPRQVAAAHGDELFTQYFWAMTRYLAGRSLSVVTISEAVKSDLVRLLGVAPDKVSAVPGASEQSRFRPRERAKVSAALERFNLEYGDPYCIFVGTHHPHKRLPWLLDVLGEMRRELPARAKLLVVGKHREQDWRQANLVGGRGLEGVVVFTGEVSDDELACLYSGARALAVSSVDEGFCLPPLEALCCGCEVIAPDLAVMRETTGGRAHFYTHDDGRLSLLLAEAFGGALPRKAQGFRSRFSWEASGDKLSDILLGALAAPPRFLSRLRRKE
jgi:glycosyltransferase involved in cell wall biosynthesis